MAQENRSWGYDRIVGALAKDMRSLIRRSATCCVVTVYRRRQSANAAPRAQNSFGSTSRCLQGLTFPEQRSLREDS
jgi:hypothetical protein